MAGGSSDAAPKSVIYGQLLAGPDPPTAAEENAAPQLPNIQVRLATVIDELGTVPSPSVNGPVSIQAGKTNPLRLAAHPEAAYRFGAGDSVAGVFNHQPSAGDTFAGEDAEMVNPRWAYLEPKARDWRVNPACSQPSLGHSWHLLSKEGRASVCR